MHWMHRVVEAAGLDPARVPPVKPGDDVAEVWDGVCDAFALDPWELAERVAAYFHAAVADFDHVQPGVTKLVPASVAERFDVFPLRARDRVLTVATPDPSNMEAEQEVEFTSGRTVRMDVAPPREVRIRVREEYAPERLVESMLQHVEHDVDAVLEVVEEEAEEVAEVDVASGPVVKLTNMLLHEAIARGASDVHLQPLPTHGVVRFRIDGVLRTGMTMPLPVLTRVISRIKVMGKMDIADRLRPQDGRARVSVGGRSYDLRISTVPARNAEKAVIRILDPQQSGTLDETGIREPDLSRMRSLLQRRDGIFVVTGPTGSGKTTTLYAALREISTEDVNIMTVEDPVEYELPGLTQIQVEPRKGVTFASALRAILRQDPDVIFVGEIRDGETAEIAAQASLTGHLVLATLHTNDAIGAVRRFADLGLDLPTVTETLRGSLAQRLVRRVCQACAVPATPPWTSQEARIIEETGVEPRVRSVGCAACDESGFQGRVPVTELMVMTPSMERLILDGAPPHQLLEQARRDGMRTLRESALELVREGLTTVEEVERVVGEAEAKPAPHPDVIPIGRARPEPTPAQGGAGSSGAPRPEPDQEDGEQPHVLVVDDDPINRTVVRALLEHEGYQVTEAADGAEALVHVAHGTSFSLMVLDLDMPMLGGRDVLRAIRANPLTAGLPVVVLTGSKDPDAEMELLEAGADDYLRKPLDPPRFMTRVRAVLRRAAA